MTKVDQDFEMWAGDTKIISSSTSGSDGNAVNITGGSITYVIASCPSGSAIVTRSNALSTCGISITDASAGKYEVTLSPSHTASLAGRYYHESEIKDSSSNISTAFTGYVTIRNSAAEGT